MRRTTHSVRKMCVAAGVLVLSAVAAALPLDAQITVDRALNSPTLTVRYNGAKAVLVELRLNGESIGTRTVSSAKDSGETNFNIDLSGLKDGDNEVEIRLFDRTGKLIGSDKINLSTDGGNVGPVYLSAPKVGATVMGNVEISVGFGRELKNSYVSFFVNDQFKSMTNFPPYVFNWDTTREQNGWHEVQAWVVDDSNETLKTRKVRIFVNNPGGRTERPGVGSALTTVKNPLRAGVTGAAAGTRQVGKVGSSVASAAAAAHAVPGVSGWVVANRVKGGQASGMSGVKPANTGALSVSGVRNMTPTGARLAVPVLPKATPVIAKVAQPVHSPKIVVGPKPIIEIRTAPAPVVAKVDTHVAAATQTARALTTAGTLIPITKGQKIPNLGSFAVLVNNSYVNFDVETRVDAGVPMTPFRHLVEKAGGKVEWENMSKSVEANSEGHRIFFQIGDPTAKIDALSVSLEVAPYLDRGRTIVPLSFIREALNVNVEYDKATGHVLITKK